MSEIKMIKTSESDLDNLLSLWNDGEVMQYVGFPNGLGIDSEYMTVWLGNINACSRSEHYSIYHQSKGYCGEAYYDIDHLNKLAALDIKLVHAARGCGLGRYGLEFVIHKAFQFKECERVYVDPKPQNLTAIQLYKRLGFKEVDKPEYVDSNGLYLELRKEVYQDFFKYFNEINKAR